MVEGNDTLLREYRTADMKIILKDQLQRFPLYSTLPFHYSLLYAYPFFLLCLLTAPLPFPPSRLAVPLQTWVPRPIYYPSFSCGTHTWLVYHCA
ncbi:transmembrane protein, putative [Medicago truncatula]|uniref:Transmembrane protein, putative n=1 Tax=Medicago truncatula TaxID=3880 RepID=G7KHE8_MEDTR|nr:transmembrane protein, putative [Medicago truncatula]